MRRSWCSGTPRTIDFDARNSLHDELDKILEIDRTLASARVALESRSTGARASSAGLIPGFARAIDRCQESRFRDDGLFSRSVPADGQLRNVRSGTGGEIQRSRES